MIVGFGLCAFLSLINSIVYFIVRDLQYNYLKAILNLVIVFGACFAAIPWDHGNLLILHGLGALFFIVGFGILNFTHQILRFIRKHQEIPDKRRFDYYLDASMVVVVFISILFLIISFILSQIIDNLALEIIAAANQKIVLIVACIAIFLLDLDDM
ncbi:MAG: hypothetical protein FK730_10940 [Asgard group archaeon]|nr:hypothetical protein [Asgard group archaeon]